MKRDALLILISVLCIAIAFGWGLDHFEQNMQRQLAEEEKPIIGNGGLQIPNRSI